jgi:hypothetical protein
LFALLQRWLIPVLDALPSLLFTIKIAAAAEDKQHQSISLTLSLSTYVSISIYLCACDYFSLSGQQLAWSITVSAFQVVLWLTIRDDICA